MTPPTVAAAPAVSKRITWEVDPAHSMIGFTIRHLMIAKVHGVFLRFAVLLKLDRQTLSNSSVEASVDAASLETHDLKRDEHLRSADFFDAKTHQSLLFSSTTFQLVSPNHAVVSGNLTIRGVTKHVAFDVESVSTEMKDPSGQIKIAASATTTINRSDFGVSWNAALETGGVLIGDEVGIKLDLQFVKMY